MTATPLATVRNISRNTVTVYKEEEEANGEPEFECPEMSVTNDQGATVQLGDDCGLTLYPPPGSSSAALAPRDALELVRVR